MTVDELIQKLEELKKTLPTLGTLEVRYGGAYSNSDIKRIIITRIKISEVAEDVVLKLVNY